MKHFIEFENYIRNSDGKSMVRVVLNEIEGANLFSVVCDGDDFDSALLILSERLRYIAGYCSNLSNKLSDKEFVFCSANSSSRKILKLVKD